MKHGYMKTNPPDGDLMSYMVISGAVTVLGRQVDSSIIVEETKISYQRFLIFLILQSFAKEELAFQACVLRLICLKVVGICGLSQNIMSLSLSSSQGLYG